MTILGVNKKTSLILVVAHVAFYSLLGFYLASNNICVIQPAAKESLPKRHLLILDNWYREQLTQMQVVVAHLLHIAKETNRIAVLPYVANSHLWWPSARGTYALGNASLLPFSSYFDIDYKAAGINPNDVIEMDEYLAKTSPNRDVVALYALCWAPNCSPRFQIVDCDNAKYPMDHFEYWATGKSSLLNGERQLYGYFLAKKKICFEIENWNPEPVLRLIHEYMEDDVVFTYYHKHIFPLESIDSTIFKPSKALQNEANNFIQNYLNLGNYVAVHWRMESTHASNIPWLVPEVLRAINEVMEISGTNTLFLATEFGNNGSDSWRPEEKTQKQKYYQSLTSQLVTRYNVIEGYKPSNIKDAGQIAIIDRLLCVQSKIFVPVEMGSSYTRYIVAERGKKRLPVDTRIYANYQVERQKN